MRIALICSTGGHLSQLQALGDWWRRHERLWITFDNGNAENILTGESVVWAHHPTTRHLGNALRNLVLAVRVLRSHRPDLIVSTGAGVALPFFVVARVLGIRTVYLEVVDRLDSRTLTGRLVYPLTDGFAVQWAEQHSMYPGARVIGATI